MVHHWLGRASWQGLAQKLAIVGLVFPMVALVAPGAHVARAETIVTTCTAAGIQAALTTGGAITLNCGAATIPITTELTAPVNATIDGGQARLDGESARRILTVMPGIAVTLTNVSLVNGAPLSGGGGAIRVEDGGTLTTRNATFQNNFATVGVSPYGGAIYGGAGSAVVLRDSRLIGNQATAGGGVLGLGSVVVESSTIERNTATAINGGGIVAMNGVTISHSTIISNAAGVFGGGVTANWAVITGSTFQANTTTGDSGGGLFTFGNATITGTSFISNTAFGFGGGISVFGRGDIHASTFVSNVARLGAGGGAYLGSPSSVVDSVVDRNRTDSHRGGGIGSQSTLTITGSMVTNNRSLVSGGGVFADIVVIASSQLLSNTAPWAGGLEALTATIDSSIFAGNRALNLHGGGMQISSFAAISRSTLRDNEAFFAGGGLNATRVVISDSLIVSNTARSAGGLFANDATFSGSAVIGNRATEQIAGGISGNRIAATNTTFAGNSSPVEGGAISFSQSLLLTNATVSANSGPAIAGVMASLPFTLADSIIGGPAARCAFEATALLGKNLIPDVSCGGGAGLLLQPVNLGPLQDNGGPTPTLAPLSGSPAIGGSPGCRTSIDQRGLPRTDPCDLGAYQTNTRPALSSLDPVSAVAVSPDLTLTVRGSGFIQGTVVLWNDSPRQTTVVSPTMLLAAIPSADLVTSGSTSVRARYSLATDSASNALSFTITKAPQSISFGPLPDRLAGDLPFDLSATASSGLAVTFSASGVCTVAGSRVTLTGMGTCTITASQPGNGSYSPAELSQTFTVRSAAIPINRITLPAIQKDRFPE